MESVRVRLVFDEDKYILTKSQRSLGLNRSWLLVNPQHLPTFSQLSAHLLHIFHLHQSSPHGLLLSMDGFVLPPFESTSILKDKEIISVKRKGGRSNEIRKTDSTADSLQDFENVDKQHLDIGVPLDGKLEMNGGDYESESEEDAECLKDIMPKEKILQQYAVHKERKASTELQSSTPKKHRTVVSSGVEKNDQKESGVGQGLISKKASHEKLEKASNAKNQQNIGFTQHVQTSSSHSESTSDEKSDQLQENDKRDQDMSEVANTTRKAPSRSARRKKAKRQWLRATANIRKKSIVCKSKLPPKRKQRRAEVENKEIISQSKGPLEQEEHENKICQENPNEKSDEEDEIVPVVIRPGHIRFEPLEEGEVVQQNQVSVETYQWNGITSKRKGQKWGTEKISSAGRHEHQNLDHDHRDFDPNQLKKSTTDIEISVNNPLDFDKISVNNPLDFDKLFPLQNLPKEGDVIAYRILVLSSTWTPEVSDFRVGSVLWYKPESRAVMLIPVPEYPVIREKTNEDDESAPQIDNSVYNEDGSLEVDFSSLIDVRIVKLSNSDSGKEVIDCSNSNSSKAVADDKVNDSAPTNGVLNLPKAGNGDLNLLDHFSEALNAKKAQLYEENSWIKDTPSKKSWSYRSLRGSALGPVMALLRSNNDI